MLIERVASCNTPDYRKTPQVGILAMHAQVGDLKIDNAGIA